MKPNLLVLTSRFPYPLEKGDKLRIYHQIKTLSKSFNVYLFSISEKKVNSVFIYELEPYISDFLIVERSKIQIYSSLFFGLFSKLPLQVSYFYSKKAKEQLEQKIKDWEIDGAYCQLIRMSKYLDGVKLWKALDFMDAFSLGLSRRSTQSSFLKQKLVNLELRRVKAYEQQQLLNFNQHFIIAKNDRHAISDKKIKLLKNGVDLEFFKPNPKFTKKYDLVFVGNMQYYPNVLAVKTLVKAILPLCIQRGFSFNVLIAGANPTNEVMALESEFVHVSGWLDDIREAYWSSSIFVAPLFTGSGLQNKVLEAMSCKIPVLTTSVVNDSLGGRPGIDLFIGDTNEELADKIEEIYSQLNTPPLAKCVDQAKLLIENKYSWESNTQPLIDVLISNI